MQSRGSRRIASGVGVLFLFSGALAAVTTGQAAAASVVPAAVLSQCNHDPGYDASNDPNTCDRNADGYFRHGGAYHH
jgi:hypothetical protein